MLQLFIDTSSEQALVGLAHGAAVLESIHLPLGLHNSKLLFPALMELFDRQRLSPKDLTMIACGVGPGSYTGIRVGAATAQSMAYALRIPLVAVSSLELYAPSEDGKFAAVLDGRVSGIYALVSDWKEGALQPLTEPAAIPLDQAAEALKGVHRIVSPHRQQLENKLSGDWVWEEGVPSARLFAERASHLHEQGRVSHNAELPLLYLRKTQAEIERC